MTPIPCLYRFYLVAHPFLLFSSAFTTNRSLFVWRLDQSICERLASLWLFRPVIRVPHLCLTSYPLPSIQRILFHNLCLPIPAGVRWYTTFPGGVKCFLFNRTSRSTLNRDHSNLLCRSNTHVQF